MLDKNLLADCSHANLMKFISRGQDDWWKEQIEEELVVEADGILDEGTLGELDDKTRDHAYGLLASSVFHGSYGSVCRTCEDRDDCLVYCLDFLLMQHVTSKQGGDEEHDQNKEGS